MKKDSYLETFSTFLRALPLEHYYCTKSISVVQLHADK